MVKALKVLH